MKYIPQCGNSFTKASRGGGGGGDGEAVFEPGEGGEGGAGGGAGEKEGGGGVGGEAKERGRARSQEMLYFRLKRRCLIMISDCQRMSAMCVHGQSSFNIDISVTILGLVISCSLIASPDLI